MDAVDLNGVSQSIVVGFKIVAKDASNNKEFTASYNLTGSGKYEFAQAYTPDLTLQKIGVNFDTERATVSASSHQDYIAVSVWFDDSAQ